MWEHKAEHINGADGGSLVPQLWVWINPETAAARIKQMISSDSSGAAMLG